MNEKIVEMICKAAVASSCAIGGGIVTKKALDIHQVKSAERAKRREIEEAAHMEELREEERKKAEIKHRFDERVHNVMTTRNFDADIRNASINNKRLAMEDRLHAKELLEIAFSRVKNSSTIESFDKYLNKFDQLFNDICTNDTESSKAGIRYWWDKHEEERRNWEENQRKREAEEERKHIEKKEEEERKRKKKEEEAERRRAEEKAERERKAAVAKKNAPKPELPKDFQPEVRELEEKLDSMQQQ